MDFMVNRADLRNVKITSTPHRPLEEGEARLRIEHFSLTANNITYAAAGDFLKYWNFFPAPEGWGRVPVWGFAEVVESRAEGVPVESRYYGYYPMSRELIVEPTAIGASGFTDGAAHRQGLAPIYNRYLNTENDPAYDAATEDLQMLFRPLFGTAFLIDDFLAEEGFFGATRVIFASASSKTAYSTAFLLSNRPEVSVVGLTSTPNVDFVKSLGIYDEVVSYDELESLDAAEPAVFVDMAGNSALRARVHQQLAGSLNYSCSVGLSHWDKNGPVVEELPGPAPVMFFAPDQSVKRVKELGPAEFQRRYGESWGLFLARAQNWVKVEHFESAEDLKINYMAFIEGQAPATAGYIHSL